MRRIRTGRAAAWVAAALVAILFVAIPDPQEFARARGAVQRISIATGGTGGVWYPYGGGVASIISRHVPNVEATAEVTAASVDNLKLLRQGSADLAFSIADVVSDAHQGSGPFEQFGRVPVRTLAVLYTQYTHVATLDGKGIGSLEDLRGRVVSLGPAGSGTESLARRVLEAAGIDPDRGIRPQTLSVAESVAALRDGKIDAFFWSGGVPTGAVLDLASTPGRRLRLIPNTGVIPALHRRYGASIYFETEVPPGTYPGVDEAVPVVGLASVLLVDEQMSEELAYEITRALFENRDELIAVHPEGRHLNPETAVAGSPAPYHPGAIRYYREQGAWRS